MGNAGRGEFNKGIELNSFKKVILVRMWDLDWIDGDCIYLFIYLENLSFSYLYK